jgi:hypothetical protein
VVERRPEKAGVASSILAPGTIPPHKVDVTKNAGISNEAGRVISNEAGRVISNEAGRVISNEAGRVKSVFSSFLANSSTLLGRRTKYVLFCRFYFSVSP